MRNILSFLWEISKIIIIALVVVIPIRYFLFQPFIVKGASMEPNFHSGDYLIIDEISYRFNQPHRGDVIVFKFPRDPSQRYIKRLIGLPNDTIEIKSDKIIISNGKESQVLDESSYLPESSNTLGDFEISLKDGEYFVLGDNREFSSDSRKWGVLPEKLIIGRVFLRAWPVVALAKIEAPAYPVGN
jgi:signal peptidase I